MRVSHTPQVRLPGENKRWVPLGGLDEGKRTKGAETSRGIGHHAALQQQPAMAAVLARRIQQAMTAAAQANMMRAPQLCACG
jgi:hypothetical protein